MRKRLKKCFVALVTFVVSAVAALSACGGGSGGGGNFDPNAPLPSNPQVLTDAGLYPILKDEYKDIKLTLMGASDATLKEDWSKNAFFTRMNELTGVDFDFKVFYDETYTEKKGKAFNTSGQLPDIFFKAFFSNYDELMYGEKSGQLRDLTELIDNYAPNIKALLEKYPRVKKSITTQKGAIYSLPTIYVNNEAGDVLMRGFWWINQTWLEEVNKPMPKTVDDLYEVLKAFKARYNCTPLVVAGEEELVQLFTAFGIDGSQYWVQEKANGVLEFTPTTEKFKACLQFFNKLVSEGLMNSDWASLDANKKTANGPNNTYGLYYAASPFHVSGNNLYENFVAMDPLTSAYCSTPFWNGTDNLQRGCFAISATCQYPELAIRWIDTLYDIDENYWIWAIAGGEDAEWVWTDEEKTGWKYNFDFAQYGNIMADKIVQPGDGMPYAVNEAFYDKCEEDLESHIRPYRMQQMRQAKVSYPLVYFTLDDLEYLSDLATDVDTTINEFMAPAINYGLEKKTGSYDTRWNSFKSKIDACGIEDYVDILQGAYTDFNTGL